MSSVNKWIGIGNLGADPDLKQTSSGRSVCNLSIACNEKFKDKSGERQERTEWVRVTVWGEQAEACAKYLAKGRQVYCEGRLTTRSYDDKEGKKRYLTEIIAEKVVFLGGGERSEGGQKPQGGKRGWGGGQDTGSSGPPPAGDDDIPF